jgi:hypothetical protein
VKPIELSSKKMEGVTERKDFKRWKQTARANTSESYES